MLLLLRRIYLTKALKLWYTVMVKIIRKAATTMLDKILTAIEPFALTLVILAGANLAGWVQFSDRAIVGTVTVFFGVLLVIKHVTTQVRTQNIKSKKG